MFQSLLDTFWDEGMWLPPNTTWDDVAPGPDKPVVYNDYRHLLYPLPLAMMLIVLRHILEKYCFAPFGKSLGIETARPKKAPYNHKLEVAYKTSPSSKIKHKQICALAKQLDMSERKVERWWRLRRSQDKPSMLVKFCENAWRGTFYLYNFSFGLFVLWGKEWLWDIDFCYIGYPHQGNTTDVWWYLMVTSSYYWSLTISQFWDVRRKDFWQMVVHHFTANALIAISWVCNLHRIGTLVILSHDISEIFLEMTKAMKYAGYQRFCDCAFVVFTLLWMVTRMGIFPFHIIWSSFILMPTFPAGYILMALLCLLFMLHVLWTWMILKVVYITFKSGQIEGDIRSSSSEVSDDSCTTSTTALPVDSTITKHSAQQTTALAATGRLAQRAPPV